MENKFKLYDQFSEKSSFFHLTNLLEENQIPFEVEDNTPPLDGTIGRNDFNIYYFVKLKEADFQKVDEILDEEALKESQHLDKDYYLYAFTDEELMEVVIKKEEWSRLDFVMAKQLLKERNIDISPELFSTLRKYGEKQSSEEKKASWLLITIGYITSLLGGILGIIIGLIILSTSKNSITGDTIYAYSASDRKHGKSMLIISFIVLLISVISRFFVED